MKLPELKPYDYEGKAAEIYHEAVDDGSAVIAAALRECAAATLVVVAFYLIDNQDAFPQDKFRREAAVLRKLNNK